jgi:hypothetical protein
VKLEVPIPPGAEDRAHRVAMAAFASHRPAPPSRNYWRPAFALAVVTAAVGVLASPPGRSVIHAIREAVGVKKAQKELFSLPAPGRLLVNSTRGAWVVQQNGSKRLLGPYREASWSPFGRFVVAVRGDELVTMEPNGSVHWTLTEQGVRSPRWGGLKENTRIAYLARDGLHVVAGDGSNDRLMATETGPLAWRPGFLSELAYVSAREVQLEDTEPGRVQVPWRASLGPNQPVLRIAWSADGTRLLVVSAHGFVVLDAAGKRVTEQPGSFRDATFVGRTHQVATLSARGDIVIFGKQVLFHSPGLRQVVSSPDGRWLLLTWPAANQWVFVRVAAPHTIRAYSGITRQFGMGKFPVVAGWVGK